MTFPTDSFATARNGAGAVTVAAGTSASDARSHAGATASDRTVRGQPLTEPAVSPCTMYFWKTSTSRTAGKAPRKPEAAITE